MHVLLYQNVALVTTLVISMSKHYVPKGFCWFKYLNFLEENGSWGCGSRNGPLTISSLTITGPGGNNLLKLKVHSMIITCYFYITLFSRRTQSKLIFKCSVDSNVAFVSQAQFTVSYCCIDQYIGYTECFLPDHDKMT